MALSTTSRPHSVELISEDAKFNHSDVESFIKSITPQVDGTSYGIVAIIGRQATGKSTLMNGLFNCDFQVRNVDKPTKDSRTTKGVWLAYDFKNTLVMDIEGADGRARGENTLFEKQTALLAISVADVVIINTMFNDVNTVNGGLQPLLTTIFEAYEKLRGPHKKSLMFVVRDYRGNEDHTESFIKNTNEIWDSIPKSNNRAPFSDCFEIEVATLPNSIYEEEQWKKKVTELRERICKLNAFSRTKEFYVSDLRVHLQPIWQRILEDKDIDIPSERNLTISFRCEEIAKEIYSDFSKKVDEVRKGPKSLGVDGFKRRLEELEEEHSSRYDTKTNCYDVSIREVKGNELKEKLKILVDKIVSKEEVREAEEAKKAAEEARLAAEEKALKASEEAKKAHEQARLAAEETARTAQIALAAKEKALALAEESVRKATDEARKAAEEARLAAEEKAKIAEKARAAEQVARALAEQKARAAEEKTRLMEKDDKKVGKVFKKLFRLIGENIFG